MKKTKFGKSILTVILSLIMVFEMIVPFNLSAQAISGYAYEGGAGSNKVADLDTSTKYSESLGDNASTEYSGRIWTDKSVYSSDVTFETYGGGSSTIKLNDGQTGEDFLIAYSALATTQSVSGQTQAPVDVVLIIDISGSMSNGDSNMDNNRSRIYNTVQATNNAIDELMALNPYTRVAVVAFSSNAQVLLPLDRYTKTTRNNGGNIEDVPYFSLNRETGSNNYATLYTRAINSDGNPISRNTDVEGGTNIQMGLYEGMQILAEEASTTANINGEIVKRVPSVILLSDGSPTYSSNSAAWWAPSDNYNDGPGSAPYAGNGMKAILVGSYMKDAIDRNYGVADTSFETTVYTIGMGITGLATNEKNLAYMTLDPGKYWNDNNVTNNAKTTIKNYWNSYVANNNTGTLNINVGQQVRQGNRYVYADKNYALTHPTTGYDVDAVDGYDYVDDYYDADNASAVTSVFEEIVANIAISAPQVPTEIKGTDPMTDGYITYTDPIGEYMEVKDVKAIIYAGTTFVTKSVVTNGNVTTYTFTGIIDSAVYGHQELKNIIITVTETNGKQTLVVKIPASVIPLRVNEVNLNANGTVKTHTNNGAYPARIIYSVGLQDEILKKSDAGVVYVDRTKLSQGYIDANTNADGTINFYTNIYTGQVIEGVEAGNALVEFEPSHSNGFYYILEDMPIYKDAQFTTQVTATEGLDDNTVYYYRDEYYHGVSVEIDAIERTGAQLKRTTIKTGNDGYLYRMAGTPRLNRILRFEGTKIVNATETAEDFYLPTFEYAANNNAYDGKFVIHLGNNGVFALSTGGNLEISKTVLAAAGLTAPDKEFTFKLNIDGANVYNGEFDYIIVDATGATVGNGTLSSQNDTFTLKDGQTATVFSLPDGISYEVTETAEAGFVSSPVGATGTIKANETAVAQFTNTYNVTSVTWPAQSGLNGTKVLNRQGGWTAEDIYTFYLRPYNNAPLPANYDPNVGVVVNGPDVAGGNTASFDFGNIEFTAPGVYRYTVYEEEPENHEYLPGMTYSRALYRIVVTVVDNGNGTLTVANSDIQKLYTDDAEQLFAYDADNNIVMNAGQEAQDEIVFVNTYDAASVTRVPVALKEYTDNSGQKPLVSGMFEFQLKALGYLDDAGQLVQDVTNVPMPQGSVNGVITTTNEGHNIVFPAVTFDDSNIPAGKTSVTFRYELSEIAGSVNGMVYDNTKYVVDVIVSVDPTSHIVNVDAVYPGTENVAVFRNTYTPEPVYDSIEGDKTLNGRDMKAGENFEFVLGANAATSLAIGNGDVVVPNSNAYVSGVNDGQVADFAFEDIRFNKAGTYVFTVSETAGNAASVEYDDTIYTVTVVVDDTNDDGKLEIVSNSNDTVKASFINNYTSEFSGTSVSLTGTKKLVGKSLLAGEFYFDVVEYYNGDKVGERYVSHTADETPDSEGAYEGTITILDGVTYDKAGTYEYVITEQMPLNPVHGTTYSNVKYRYTVVVEDDLAGNLKVESTSLYNVTKQESANEVEFVNNYTPSPTTAEVLLVKKVLSGDRATPLQPGEFQFKISVVSPTNGEGIQLPSATTISNAANGDVQFENITFTKPGYYVVAIEEVVPDDANKAPGVDYSEQVITAVYHVTDDRNGTLTAVLTDYTGGEVIYNQYAATPVDSEIEITKDFTGRENDAWLATDKFEFQVKLDAETATALANGEIEMTLDNGSSDTVTTAIEAKGHTAKVAFKANKAGTYTFVITEINGGLGGITYDTAEYKVAVTIEDNNAGKLVETGRVITKNDSAANDVVFSNTYKAAEVGVEISGKKELAGRKLNDGEFSFELYETGSDFVVAEGADALRTTVNAADGTITFEAISISEAGTKYYVVKESTTNKVKGVTYDKTNYKITVTVTDNLNGKLLAILKTEEDSEVVFKNVFTPDDIQVQFNINKILRKQVATDMGLDGFKFKLEAEGLEEYAVSDENGKAVFNLTYTAKDIGKTFKYTITEVDTQVENVEYSKSTVTVEVAISCNEYGQLKATLTQNGQSTDVVETQFVNTYKGTPEPVPDTGVGQYLWMWIALFAISGVVTFGSAAVGRKQEVDEN